MVYHQVSCLLQIAMVDDRWEQGFLIALEERVGEELLISQFGACGTLPTLRTFLLRLIVESEVVLSRWIVSKQFNEILEFGLHGAFECQNNGGMERESVR